MSNVLFLKPNADRKLILSTIPYFIKMKLRLAIFAFLISLSLNVWGQKVAVKTNLLYDATATVNAGLEFGLAPRWTFDLSGNLNAWEIKSGSYWKHILVQPELRYWFCDRFAGTFLAVHGLGGIMNVGGIDLPTWLQKFPRDIDLSNLKDQRYQGWFAGAGVGLGYDFVLGKHWNLELEAGYGWVFTKYDSYVCEECGDKLEEGVKKNYFGPTKAAVNLVYVF